jgi:hypothetical protein
MCLEESDLKEMGIKLGSRKRMLSLIEEIKCGNVDLVTNAM